MAEDRGKNKNPDLPEVGSVESDAVFYDAVEDSSFDQEVFYSPKQSPVLQHGAQPSNVGGGGDHEPLRKTSSYFSKLHDKFYHRSKPQRDPLSSSDGLLCPNNRSRPKSTHTLTPPLSAPSNRRISAPPMHGVLHRLHSKPLTSNSSSSSVAKRSSGLGIMPVSVWVSGAGEDSDVSSASGVLRPYSRFYGSTGNLLDMADSGLNKTNLAKRHLGKSLQLVSGLNLYFWRRGMW